MIHYSGGPISVHFGSVDHFINNQMLTTVIYQLTSSDWLLQKTNVFHRVACSGKPALLTPGDAGGSAGACKVSHSVKSIHIRIHTSNTYIYIYTRNVSYFQVIQSCTVFFFGFFANIYAYIDTYSLPEKIFTYLLILLSCSRNRYVGNFHYGRMTSFAAGPSKASWNTQMTPAMCKYMNHMRNI